ncbi:hypothetical protein MNEG_8601 [Monoraphidium neglectum]|uniref:FAS1 domain-containing protein n=1 Tax=Monoraphidium neglectum TaxID=145388 RepID=A0A0D2M7L0_9CHLO|nr:hypothetical protein MNEG_8601 [Monoraphidium neglectum]KIY99359.1 hypothetical protein MNEG_8601 [Monoraphidium neglectum]|eukprot:XP_013898379.1 hypothetical protein MNEG_8601 [Monoraphidium neglectum]
MRIAAYICAFGAVLLAAQAAQAAHAASAQQASFPTFLAALGATPNTNYGKQIVESLRLQTTLSNPKLALTIFMPEDKYFDALAAKLNVKPTAMSKNTGLMRQARGRNSNGDAISGGLAARGVLLYHFVTGPTGVRKVLPTSALQAGQRLDTMYQSSTTRKPYQLAVNAVNGKLQIKSVGTTAYIVKPNIRAGAGLVHMINNVLVPMNLNNIPRF